ncbi:MAG: hypothetical protein ABMB14_28870 [Myxococcota bacterium]
MTHLAAWLLAGSCRHAGPTVPLPPTDTGQRALPDLPYGFVVPPSARLIGMPGSQFGGHVAVVPAYQGDPSVLLADIAAELFPDLDLDWVLLMDGAVPRGDHHVLDWWDGVSTYRGMLENLPGHDTSVAGDVNDDGHLDLWLSLDLHLGPILGRKYSGLSHDGVAWIDEGDYNSAALGVPVGQIDADQDGVTDVLFAGPWLDAYIYYGPFHGRIPAYLVEDADPTQFSSLGVPSCFTHSDPTVLRDHLGPGHPAIAIGNDLAGDCGIGTFVWDLLQPRGTHLTEQDAIALGSQHARAIHDAGHLFPDQPPLLIYGGFWSDGVLLAAPVSGWLEQLPPSVVQQNGFVHHAIGDINGDGVDELLADASDAQIVLFSPYDHPLDVTRGLDLGSIPFGNSPFFGEIHADLDGDGRSDLVNHTTIQDDRHGEIWIWYGADLLAAYEATLTEESP